MSLPGFTLVWLTARKPAQRGIIMEAREAPDSLRAAVG